eukprot:Skav225131  [mRNA]  locus=scaffold1056:55793:56623:+ [translate_table: standard]
MQWFAGPLDQFGSWGRRDSVWIAVRGPAHTHQRPFHLTSTGKTKSDVDREWMHAQGQVVFSTPFIPHQQRTHELEQKLHNIWRLQGVESLLPLLPGQQIATGFLGGSQTSSISITGPPDQKRYTLCIYKDESSCNKGGNPEVEVELLKVLSVQPDPARSEVFIINYLEKNTLKVKQRLTFSRIDRARDIWVEMLTWHGCKQS